MNQPVHSVTTDATAEPLSLAEMKRHLRVTTNELDTEVLAAFRGAREWLERLYDRTFRTAVVRKIKRDDWPTGQIYLGYPPLIQIDSVKYYDADNSQQTISSSDYYVLTSTWSTSYFEMSSTYTVPAMYQRPDAFEINYQTGYASASLVPETAKNAIRVLAYAYFHDDDQDKVRAAEDTATRIMTALDWGAYR